jgi:hypothetical protein
MYRIRTIGRPVALLTIAAVLLAVVAWFSGSVPQQDEAFADSDWGDQYYVTCSDTYLDIPPLVIKGQPPGDEDIIASKSIGRGEPSRTQPGAVDLTMALYLGPDMNGDLIADKGVSALPCTDEEADGQFVPENNRLHNDLHYGIQAVDRTTVAKMVPKGPDVNIEYTTCYVDATSGNWIRTDVSVVEANKGAKSVNYGVGTLYSQATSPTDPEDPTTCDTALSETLWVNMFPFVIVSQSRDATTDHPEEPRNVLAMARNELVIDPDGPNQPKPKDAKQVPDGADELAGGPYERGDPPHVSPMLADDWDGDGCPDWDELDPDLDPHNGLDPFNPHDCNQVVNVGGIYRIRAVPLAGTKEAAGAYFHCIADMQQDGNDLEMRLYCYTDNPAIPVNPEAGDEVGDGYEGLPPPAAAVDDTNPPAESGAQCQNGQDDDGDTVADDGCPAIWGDVDDAHSALTGALDKGTNRMTMSGCYEDRDGTGALGAVYLESDQDAHDGKGTVDIYVFQERADGQPAAGRPPRPV